MVPPALHARHVVVVLDCFVLEEDGLTVGRHEDGDDEELSEIDGQDELTDLLTVLEHDELILAVRHYKLKAACDGGNGPLWVQNRHLLLVVQVVKAQFVLLIDCSLATLCPASRHVDVKFVLQA